MKRPYPGVGAALVTASPFVFADAWWVYGARLWETWWVTASTALASLVLLSAGITLRRRPFPGRILTTSGVALLFALHLPQLIRSPGWTLAALLLASIVIVSLWTQRSFGYRVLVARQPEPAMRARGAATAALVLWLVANFRGASVSSPHVWIPLGLALLVPVALALVWIVKSRRQHLLRARILGATMIACIGAIFWSVGDWWKASTLLALIAATALLVLPFQSAESSEQVDWWDPVLSHPERLFVATFLALSLAGTFLLALPAASSGERGIGFVDAAFMSVSAVCITGLLVRDTAVDFSFAGQLFILFLMQLGGLGIMTFSTAAMRLLGRRMSLRQEGAVARLVSPKDRSRVFASTRQVILFTLAAEAVGTALLTPAFAAAGDPGPLALWRALFTSVSAFCNAGFALQSTSLIPYQTSALVLHTVAALMVLGGLSPALVLASARLARRGSAPPSAQYRLALLRTAILLAVGFIVILVIESSNTLQGLSRWDRIHNAWFQSVTLRSGGFNSVAIESLRPATITLVMIWMFIGGSPGGTTGGIKTTTVGVLVLAVITAIRGHVQASAFGRVIPHRTVYKAAAIATVGIVSVFAALTAIQLTQRIDPLSATFEVVSALGTVGLTLGATAQADGVGKVILALCMFAGRVGPLTLFMFLNQRVAIVPWKRPEEEIDVG